MDIAQVLQAAQSPDPNIRQPAEQQIESAKQSNLVSAPTKPDHSATTVWELGPCAERLRLLTHRTWITTAHILPSLFPRRSPQLLHVAHSLCS